MTTSAEPTTSAVASAATGARQPLRVRLGLIGASIAIYALACALPAATLVGEDVTVQRGLGLALLGWLAVTLGQYGWFANLFWIVGMLLALFRRYLGAAITVACGMLLALQTLTILGREVPLDTSGSNNAIVQQLNSGFYLWLLSMLVLVAGALLLRARERAGGGAAT